MNNLSKKALIVIDVQNDYLPDGKVPLLNVEDTITKIVSAIDEANKQNIPVILIQHIANDDAPMFHENSHGVKIHPRILQAAPKAKTIIKAFADSFEKTDLNETLEQMGISELLICGMMTQNCVTHTAISKQAEKYEVSILADCCTTTDALTHNLALHAISTRIPLIELEQM